MGQSQVSGVVGISESRRMDGGEGGGIDGTNGTGGTDVGGK